MRKIWLSVGLVLFLLSIFTLTAVAEDVELIPYENQDIGFSFSYPADWEVEDTEGFVFFAIGDNGLNVGVIREEGDGVEGTTLSEFAQKEKGYLEKELKDFKEIEEKEVTVNGQKAILRIYEYKIKVRKFKSLEYYIQGKKDGFVVVFDGPYALFDELKKIAESSIATFKLIGDQVVSSSKSGGVSELVGRDIKPLEEWKVFVDSEKGFGVSYPGSWKVVRPYEDVVFEVDSPEGYRFQVLNHNLGKMGSVKSYFQSTGRWLKKHLADYEEIGVRELENGYERIYEFTQNGTREKVVEYYYVKKDDNGNIQGFTLVLMAPKDKFGEVEEYFDKMINSFTLNPSAQKTPTPQPTVASPTPTPEGTPVLPTPKAEETPTTLPTPKAEGGLSPDEFVHYKNPKGLFEVMIPKGLSVLDEEEDSIIYGDLSKGYIIGAGTDIFDIEEDEKLTIDDIMQKLKENLEEISEDMKVIEGPKKYKEGAMILGETEEAPYPGMKETQYYGLIYVKPRETGAIGLVVVLPKDEYEKYKPYIDFIIDSLK